MIPLSTSFEWSRRCPRDDPRLLKSVHNSHETACDDRHDTSYLAATVAMTQSTLRNDPLHYDSEHTINLPPVQQHASSQRKVLRRHLLELKACRTDAIRVRRMRLAVGKHGAICVQCDREKVDEVTDAPHMPTSQSIENIAL